MLRFLIALGASAIVMMVGVVVPQMATAAGCSYQAERLGICAQKVTADVDVGGATLRAETPAGPGAASPGGAGKLPGRSAPWVVLEWWERQPGESAEQYQRRMQFEAVSPQARVAVPDDPAAVTLADIASFRAQEAVPRMQPAGWMVVGLETNFYAEASAHTVDGVLLGQQATVRFTPIGYGWSYGDGSDALLETAGGSWESLRVAEFAQTPASHVYTQRGSYQIVLTSFHTAEYRYAGADWVGIPGTVRVTSEPITARAYTVRTVLVDEDCRQSPGGPGCLVP
ncbi:hypothetical protein [Homoserinimonas aerilata]|uniref:hypothetical protein n=1 Tax=Homoserinimonas aerilata TaxID=1162970 RepID=UPI001C897A08|nr:hypothetical protein [Homoserinimonas aerilata]